MGTLRKYRSRITRKNNFTTVDYNSNDGMLTSVWGPAFWHVLHCMSFNYPIYPTNDDKKYYMNFILNLKKVLPCGKCRSNLVNNFKKLPLNMEIMNSRDSFSKYVYDLHELINKMLSKKSGLTYNEVRDTYERFRARCKKTIEVNEKGCIVPYYGEKQKCILTIVPESKQCKSFI